VVAAERRVRKRRFTITSLVVLALLALLLLPGARVARFAAPVSMGDILWRAHIWKDTLSLIRAFSLFGCGLGAYIPANVMLLAWIAGIAASRIRVNPWPRIPQSHELSHRKQTRFPPASQAPGV
jgi:hypothetical protein